MEKPAQVMLRFNKLTESYLLMLLNDMDAGDRVARSASEEIF